VAEPELGSELGQGPSPEPVGGKIAVSVRYHNMLRRRVGIEQETITVADGTLLHNVLEILADRHGPRLREMLFSPEGSIVSHLVIFRNRKLVPQDQYQLVLGDGDELMLFPAIAGG
jgi:molybdopterin converting factor small subunit